ncbi:MAG: ABC transporter ATP-binding protein [Caldisphaera sp.]|jgi:multiple sugar transport system ATP-binding protein|uniref:ABC transporter ATP-binding protein n=1 Tax=Caldisphaera sp. TaxID=2060322 RepID=UPI000CBD0DFF|nr:MAG: ABC transporter ATP-binding protein [Caldisphaera sp.]
MEYIKLEDIWKTYKTKKVVTTPLKGLNLSIDKGELAVILGPSGEGKTTILRVIAGLIKQDKGHVFLRGKNVDDLSPKERNIAMVFQSYAIYPFMSVYDNIAYPLKISHVSKNEIESKVKYIADILKISDILQKKPSELSGGQRQRVAIAKALVKGADIILMDEPMANLDAIVRVYAREELKELHRKLNTTIVYVTHDQIEALSLATKLGILHDGIIQDYGDPMEVYKNPRNSWVASFVGNPPMNLVEGIVKNNEISFIRGNLKFGLPKRYLNNINDGQEVIIGFRPEDAIIGKGQFKGKVSMTEKIGAYTVIHIDVGDNVLLRLIQPAFANYSRGDEVNFDIKEDSLVLFDKKSGKNLLR